MGLCVCSATLWFYWVGASISLSGVCWCLVPTQFIQIIETGNNSTVKCHRKLKKALKKNKIVYAVCVDLRKCREVLFQVSMFMMYTACAGGFLAATLTSHVCKSLMHQSPPSLSVHCLLSCLQLSLSSTRTSLGSVVGGESDYSNINVDLERHQCKTASLPVPAATGSTSVWKFVLKGCTGFKVWCTAVGTNKGLSVLYHSWTAITASIFFFTLKKQYILFHPDAAFTPQMLLDFSFRAEVIVRSCQPHSLLFVYACEQLEKCVQKLRKDLTNPSCTVSSTELKYSYFREQR